MTLKSAVDYTFVCSLMFVWCLMYSSKWYPSNRRIRVCSSSSTKICLKKRFKRGAFSFARTMSAFLCLKMRQKKKRLEDWGAKWSGYGIIWGTGWEVYNFHEGEIEDFLFSQYWMKCTHFIQGPVFADIIHRGFINSSCAGLWMHRRVTCDGTRVRSRIAVFRARESRFSCSLAVITRNRKIEL